MAKNKLADVNKLARSFVTEMAKKGGVLPATLLSVLYTLCAVSKDMVINSSQQEIAEDSCVSVSSVKKCLTVLKNNNMLFVKHQYAYSEKLKKKVRIKSIMAFNIDKEDKKAVHVYRNIMTLLAENTPIKKIREYAAKALTNVWYKEFVKAKNWLNEETYVESPETFDLVPLKTLLIARDFTASDIAWHAVRAMD